MNFAHILKANPYHDETGRFSTQSNATFVSIGGKFDRPPKGKTSTSISVLGREVRVELDPVAKKQGEKLVFVDAKAFDAEFKKTDSYIGANGEGQIRTRYQDFGTFFNGGVQQIGSRQRVHSPAQSIYASEVDVREDGTVQFTNGRHRYAWLRDRGVSSIPVSMSKEAIARAHKARLLTKGQ